MSTRLAIAIGLLLLSEEVACYYGGNRAVVEQRFGLPFGDEVPNYYNIARLEAGANGQN